MITSKMVCLQLQSLKGETKPPPPLEVNRPEQLLSGKIANLKTKRKKKSNRIEAPVLCGFDSGVPPVYPNLVLRGNTRDQAPGSDLTPVTVPSTVTTIQDIVIVTGAQTTATSRATTVTSTVSTVVSSVSQERARAEHCTSPIPDPSTIDTAAIDLTGKLIEDEIQPVEEEIQPIEKETGSDSDETLESDSDSDTNSVLEVTPPGIASGCDDLDVFDDPKDVVASPPGELKTPDREKAATPKPDVVTSPSEELRTSNEERVATPPEKAAASKSFSQGMDVVTPINENEKEI